MSNKLRTLLSVCVCVCVCVCSLAVLRRDMALLTLVAMRSEVFREIVRTTTHFTTAALPADAAADTTRVSPLVCDDGETDAAHAEVVVEGGVRKVCLRGGDSDVAVTGAARVARGVQCVCACVVCV